MRESNSRPLAPEARIIPLDQSPTVYANDNVAEWLRRQPTTREWRSGYRARLKAQNVRRRGTWRCASATIDLASERTVAMLEKNENLVYFRRLRQPYQSWFPGPDVSTLGLAWHISHDILLVYDPKFFANDADFPLLSTFTDTQTSHRKKAKGQHAKDKKSEDSTVHSRPTGKRGEDSPKRRAREDDTRSHTR